MGFRTAAAAAAAADAAAATASAAAASAASVPLAVAGWLGGAGAVGGKLFSLAHTPAAAQRSASSARRMAEPRSRASPPLGQQPTHWLLFGPKVWRVIGGR